MFKKQMRMQVTTRYVPYSLSLFWPNFHGVPFEVDS